MTTQIDVVDINDNTVTEEVKRSKAKEAKSKSKSKSTTRTS